jgi:hypothetical protein
VYGIQQCRLRVPAHRLRAFQHAHHPVKLAKMARKRAQQRWRRAAHAILQAGARTDTLGDAPVGRLCRAHQRVHQGRLPQAGSPLMDEPRNATLVHGDTGHVCCCLKCAQDLKPKGLACPMCRKPIDVDTSLSGTRQFARKPGVPES